MRVTLLALLLFALPATAQQTTTYYQYKISSGTGFVINGDGHVVTNEHVVRGCKSISILTPNGEESASLVAADPKNDLALLKTPYLSKKVAPLRWNIRDLNVGSPVIVMGFPGEQGASGHEQYKKTHVVSLTGPSGEAQWIQLASVASKGNSGGPVLDTSGNVIAVISGMALTYQVDSAGKLSNQAVGRSDVAITLPALRSFLQTHGVSFQESASGLVTYSDSSIHTDAAQFIIPVRCIQDIVRR
jgi:serine protease Do